MPVSAKAFQRWRAEIASAETVTDLGRMAGIKRSTLAQQLIRGKVAESTIVSVARASGTDPVHALARFEGYEDLVEGMKPPTDAELISQISYVEVLRYLLARTAGGEEPASAASYSARYSIKAWIDAIDPGDLRQQLAMRTGVAPQNVSAQLSAGRLAPELSVEAARIAGVSLTSGLVVTELLTPDEGGWTCADAMAALAALSDADLVFLARDRLTGLGKSLRKWEQDTQRVRAVWENLG